MTWIGWNDDETVHFASDLARRRSGPGPWWVKASRLLTRRIWMKWPALCGASLNALTTGSLIDDVTCCGCEVVRIKARFEGGVQ